MFSRAQLQNVQTGPCSWRRKSQVSIADFSSALHSEQASLRCWAGRIRTYLFTLHPQMPVFDPLNSVSLHRLTSDISSAIHLKHLISKQLASQMKSPMCGIYTYPPFK